MIERAAGIVDQGMLGFVRLVQRDRPYIRHHHRSSDGKVVQLPQRLLQVLDGLPELFLPLPLVQVQGSDELERIAQLLCLDAQSVPLMLVHVREVPNFAHSRSIRPLA